MSTVPPTTDVDPTDDAHDPDDDLQSTTEIDIAVSRGNTQ
jgi:hypothetical protein